VKKYAILVIDNFKPSLAGLSAGMSQGLTYIMCAYALGLSSNNGALPMNNSLALLCLTFLITQLGIMVTTQDDKNGLWFLMYITSVFSVMLSFFFYLTPPEFLPLGVGLAICGGVTFVAMLTMSFVLLRMQQRRLSQHAAAV